MRVSWGQALQDIYEWWCAKRDDLDVICAAWPLNTKTVRVSTEYEISATGVVTALNGGPIPTVSWTPGTGANGAGNDWIVTFPAGSFGPNAGLFVDVLGDIETGSGGDIDNALIVQNVTMVGQVAGFTLYGGDDGGGEDDAARRAVRIAITDDCEVYAP